MQREVEQYKKGLEEVSSIFSSNSPFIFFQIETKLLKKDQRVAKLDTKVKSLEEEIERRRFIEGKVQTYVRSLIDQNEKCKNFIKSAEVDGKDQFLHDLETN